MDIEDTIAAIEETIPDEILDRGIASFGSEGIYEIAEVYEEILGPYNN